VKRRSIIGIVGSGKIGRAIALGLRANNRPQEMRILCSDRHPEALEALQQDSTIECFLDNHSVISHADMVILSVKPFQARSVIESCAQSFRADQLAVSICASITLEQLESWASTPRWMRAMPNLPVIVNRGVSVLTAGARCEPEDRNRATEIFSSVGHVLELAENQLDAVTALSGSGPAFMFFFIEALSEAGARLGIPKERAFELVFHTMRGSAELCLEKSIDPAELIQQVATPGGCTVEGLKVFREMNLRSILIECIEKTAQRASELRLES
jgi:pyrroline-5-carboxylate reductase